MAKKSDKKSMFYIHLMYLGVGFILGIIMTLLTNQAAEAGKPTATGYDEFGYNYNARMFSGKADGVDRTLDDTFWGDATYAKDHLIMKWSKAWDDARFNGTPWNCDAWTSNEWNGKMPTGSGETWHYKIAWVGPELESSSCWRDGGYPIWGEFEVIFSQGTVGNEHFWDAHANPAGYGVN